MCSYLRGVSRWFIPLACGPGHPELSKSYVDMASKLITKLHVHTAAVINSATAVLTSTFENHMHNPSMQQSFRRVDIHRYHVKGDCRQPTETSGDSSAESPLS